MANTSDEDNTRFCDTCKYLGLEKIAVSHCVDCIEDLCDSCTVIHASFKALRGHNIEHFRDSSNLTAQQKAMLSTVMACNVHPSETLTKYCKQDKYSICRICSVTKHRNCNTNPLSDLAGQRGFKNEEKQFIDGIKVLLHEVEEIKRSREIDKKELEQRVKKCKEDLKTFKSKIVSWLEKLEEDMLKQIVNVEKDILDKIDAHITTSDAILRQFNVITKSFEAFSTIPEATFVLREKNRDRLKDSFNIKDDIQREIMSPKVDFQGSEKLESFMSQILSIGTLNTSSSHPEETNKTNSSANEKLTAPVENASKVKVTSPALSSAFNPALDFTEIQSAIKGNTIYPKSNFVSGCTFLPQGELVICDSQNKEVKLFTPDFKLKSTLELGYQVWDVTAVSEEQVVVTVPDNKYIQFINISDSVTKGKTISVEMTCRGIDFKNDRLYVSGIVYNTCKIKVLTMNGDVVNTLTVKSAMYIAVNSYGNKIIGCDGSSGVWSTEINGTELDSYTHSHDMLYDSDDDLFGSVYPPRLWYTDINSTELYRYTDRELKWSRGVLFDSYDNFMACGEGSNYLQVVTKDGSRHKIPLQAKNRLHQPQCLAYRERDRTLVVGQRSDQSPLLAFKLG